MVAEAKQQLLNEVLAQVLGAVMPSAVPAPVPGRTSGTDKDIEAVRRFIARQERR